MVILFIRATHSVNLKRQNKVGSCYKDGLVYPDISRMAPQSLNKSFGLDMKVKHQPGS